MLSDLCKLSLVHWNYENDQFEQFKKALDFMFQPRLLHLSFIKQEQHDTVLIIKY